MCGPIYAIIIKAWQERNLDRPRSHLLKLYRHLRYIVRFNRFNTNNATKTESEFGWIRFEREPRQQRISHVLLQLAAHFRSSLQSSRYGFEQNLFNVCEQVHTVQFLIAKDYFKWHSNTEPKFKNSESLGFLSD